MRGTLGARMQTRRRVDILHPVQGLVMNAPAGIRQATAYCNSGRFDQMSQIGRMGQTGHEKQ